MKFKEIEFKYNAENISLTDFTAFCKKRDPREFILASGYDHFYDNKTDKDAFCRYRVGPDMNQLTFKRKTQDNNNFVRTEHNIDLERSVSQDKVEALCGEFGYSYNTSIFKNCFVYLYEWYTLVFYICYDTEMKELGRYFEIEMAEDANWGTEKDAQGELNILERLCKPLGILPQARIKRSLYEMFRKDS